ncbi:hypothetical protein [Shewanella sp. ENK2]|uniref:hypothetical protein n=1 Tax=Shewanella sp. ENK2 TaxID=2775245 RepID=UPI00374A78F2
MLTQYLQKPHSIYRVPSDWLASVSAIAFDFSVSHLWVTYREFPFVYRLLDVIDLAAIKHLLANIL